MKTLFHLGILGRGKQIAKGAYSARNLSWECKIKYFDCKNGTIIFKTKDQGVKAGYKPCGICNP